MKNIRVLELGDRPCLYCGKNKTQYFEEYQEYYECDCNDSILKRDIDEKIINLQRQYPREKYIYEKLSVIKKIDK